MNLTELKPNLWKLEAIPTEYSAFKILRNNPLKTNAHYLAAPWSVLLNTREQFFRNNNNPKVQRPDWVLEDGFTICQHISYTKIIPYLLKHGVTTLFTPHALKNHRDMTVLPFPHHAVNGADPSNKNLLCSFVGCLITNQVRKVMWDTRPNDPTIKIIKRSTWHYEGPNRINRQNEYRDILAKSRFSLCPRGTGPSTIRFWESLQAGAIPILISDTMRLPVGWDWHQTIIKIPESNTPNWFKIIKKVTPEDEQSMRKNCLKAYQHFSGDNLVSNIRLFFGSDIKNIPTIT